MCVAGAYAYASAWHAWHAHTLPKTKREEEVDAVVSASSCQFAIRDSRSTVCVNKRRCRIRAAARVAGVRTFAMIVTCLAAVGILDGEAHGDGKETGRLAPPASAVCGRVC